MIEQHGQSCACGPTDAQPFTSHEAHCTCEPHGTGEAQCTCEAQCSCDVGHAAGGVVTVTINPEARVSVVCSLDLMPVADRDGTISIPVTIVNGGFVTMALEAVLVEPSPPMVSLDFATESLNGSGMEHRLMVVTVRHSGVVDITIGFRLLQEEPDLGGRDRFHFLARGVVGELV